MSFYDEYTKLAHAVQSGIKFKLEVEKPNLTEEEVDRIKHLRVGIDLTRSDHGALVRLLIEKKVFTQEEYEKELIEGLKQEVATYEEVLSNLLGRVIHLG